MPSCRGQGKFQVIQASVLLRSYNTFPSSLGNPHIDIRMYRSHRWLLPRSVLVVLKPPCLGYTGEVGSC
jgi:hypothetical protein